MAQRDSTAPADDTGASASKARTAPHPDDDRKPDSPTELTKPSWRYVLKRTFGEFGKDQCTDVAAGLTYYGILSLFPAVLALVSLLGVFGQGPSTAATLLAMAGDLGLSSVLDSVEGPLLTLINAKQAAGFALVTGLLLALWSASGYVLAFSRAMNRIYEVDEGRPVWKLRPQVLAVTLVLLLIVVLLVVGLVVSGPVARTIGDVIGAGEVAVTVWSVLKWPAMLALVVLLVALLYWVTPNVKQPKFRWVSVGALLAIVTWIVLSVAFGFYVANFGSYNKTYGSLAGAIIFLLWLWLTNNALLLGAELDAELERGRQLQAGIEAEQTLQLPPRDDSASKKKTAKLEKVVAQGREIRRAHAGLSADEDTNGRCTPGTGPGAPDADSPGAGATTRGDDAVDVRDSSRAGRRS